MNDFLKQNKVLAIVIYIVIAIVILFILWQLYKWFKRQQNQLLLENSTATTSISGVPVSVNLGATAQKIYNAFHEYYYGMAEDEETAILALLGVPKPLVPQLSAIYFTAYDLNMNEDFLKYLSSSDYTRVTNLLN